MADFSSDEDVKRHVVEEEDDEQMDDNNENANDGGPTVLERKPSKLVSDNQE
jgi:hypothetical protein